MTCVSTRLVVLAAMALALLAPTSKATAAPNGATSAAEALIQEGIALRRVGRDDAALAKFEQAYGIHPTPRAAAQKGLCLQALGRFTDAEDLLAKALEGGSDPWVAKNRSTIKDSLEDVKTKIGRFEVSGSPPGAEVLVDGRLVGQLPLPGMLRINAGSAELMVQAEGFTPERTNLRVEGASFRRLEYRLKPTSLAMGPAPLPMQAQPPMLLSATPHANTDSTPTTPIYKQWWFWAGLGAVVVAGVVTTIVVVSKGDDATGTNLYPQ